MTLLTRGVRYRPKRPTGFRNSFRFPKMMVKTHCVSTAGLRHSDRRSSPELWVAVRDCTSKCFAQATALA